MASGVDAHPIQARLVKRIHATRTKYVLTIQRFFLWIQQKFPSPQETVIPEPFIDQVPTEKQELRTPSGRLITEQQLLDMFQLGKKQGIREAQKTTTPFLQAAYDCPLHGPVYVSGFPDQCPQCIIAHPHWAGDLAKKYHPNTTQSLPEGARQRAARKQQTENTDTQKVADHRPGKHLTVRLYPVHLTPLPPMDVPDRPGTTHRDEPFLLDQPIRVRSDPPTLVDPEQTEIGLPRVRRAG